MARGTSCTRICALVPCRDEGSGRVRASTTCQVVACPYGSARDARMVARLAAMQCTCACILDGNSKGCVVPCGGTGGGLAAVGSRGQVPPTWNAKALTPATSASPPEAAVDGSARGPDCRGSAHADAPAGPSASCALVLRVRKWEMGSATLQAAALAACRRPTTPACGTAQRRGLAGTILQALSPKDARSLAPTCGAWAYHIS